LILSDDGIELAPTDAVPGRNQQQKVRKSSSEQRKMSPK